MAEIIISENSKFRGRCPVTVNGTLHQLPVDEAFEPAAGVEEALTNAGVEFIAAPEYGDATGKITIPGAVGGRIPITVNGKLRYYATGIPVSIDADSLAVLVANGTAFGTEYSIVVDGETVEPLIYLDFKNGVYTVEGVSQELEDIVEENATYGAFSYDDVLEGTGIVGESSPFLKGGPLALVTGGSTIIFTFSLNAADSTHAKIEVLLYDDPAFLTLYTANVSTLLVAPSFVNDQVDSAAEPAPTSVGTHKQAVTMIDGKIARSIDGGAVVSIDPAAAWGAAPNLFSMAVSSEAHLESIGIYPAQADAALPGLSTP